MSSPRQRCIGSFTRRRRRALHTESLEPRTLLAADTGLQPVPLQDDCEGGHGAGCACPSCAATVLDASLPPGHFVGDGHDHSAELLFDPSGNSIYFDPAPPAIHGPEPATANLVDDSFAASPATIPPLHSNPSATKKIFLDFDGETVTGTSWNSAYNSNQPIHAPAFDMDGDIFSFTTAEISRIYETWQRVSEDFAPWDVDVTTEDPGSAAFAAGGQAIRLLVSTNTDDTRLGGTGNQWFGASGGVAYVDSWAWTSDTPVWVFENYHFDVAKNIAEATTHELGHSLGLSHDGKINCCGYYEGHGAGSTSWAPIMGSGYTRSVTQWSSGQYGGADNLQDDLQIINGYLGYRPDDHSNSNTNVAAATLLPSSGTFSRDGVIETNTDVDVFRFDLSGSTNVLDLSVAPVGVGPNLDVEAKLFDDSGNVVASNNPANSLDASLNIQLAAGTYLLTVDGVGKGDPQTTGYSNYGSLGQYTVSGTVSGNTVDTTSDLVAQWSFEDVIGNTAPDSATSGQVADDGTLMGNASVVAAGIGGGALALDETSDYVGVPATIDTSTTIVSQRTIGLWFYADETNSRQVLLEEGGGSRGLNIYLQDGDLWVAGWNQPASESGWAGTFMNTPVTAGQWHHATLVLDGSATVGPDSLIGYLNGVEFARGTGSQLWGHGNPIGLGGGNSDARFHSGFSNVTGANSLQGYLDDIRVFNRVLTAAEVQQLAQGSPTAPPPSGGGGDDISSDLVAYLSFENTSGNTVLDDATSGNVADNGTLSGDAAVESGVGIGNALAVDGLTDFVGIAASSDTSTTIVTERTISLWFYANETNSRQVLLEEGGGSRGLNIYLEGGSLYVGGWNPSTGESGWTGTFLNTPVTSGQWHHATLVLDGSSTVQADALVGYLDGVEFARGAGSQLWGHGNPIGLGAGNSDARFHSGFSNVTGSNSLRGYLDEVKFFNRALTSSEVQLLSQGSPAAPPVNGGPDITSNLVAQWVFEDATGNSAPDSSQAGSVADTGTLIGDANALSGVGLGGAALAVDGTSDLLAVPATIDTSTTIVTQRTIGLWFYANETNSRQVLLEEGGGSRGLNIYLESGQLYVGGWNTPSAESNWTGTFLSTTVTAGQWHHATLVLNGTGSIQADALIGYLDGVEFDRGAGSQLWGHANPMGIGAGNSDVRFHSGFSNITGTNSLNGYIDEVKIYNRVLTAADVSQLAQGTPVPPA